MRTMQDVFAAKLNTESHTWSPADEDAVTLQSEIKGIAGKIKRGHARCYFYSSFFKGCLYDLTNEVIGERNEKELVNELIAFWKYYVGDKTTQQVLHDCGITLNCARK